MRFNPKKTYSRPLCRTERVYLVYDEVCPPFVIHMILEGQGQPDAARWQAAVAQASAANPGSRLVLRHDWIFSRWVDSGQTPPVREIDGSGWDGRGSEGCPLGHSRLDYRNGPTCEVVLLRGNPQRVAFITHHAVMDGRGTMFWAEEIFRALRGEELLGSDSRLTELSIARTFQRKGRTPPPHEFISPAGKARGCEKGVVWRRIHIEGRYRNLIPTCALTLAQAAREHAEGKVRIAISVDLRPRVPGLRATGNLTNLIYLDVYPETTVEDLRQDLAQQIQDKRDGMLYWGDRLARYAPLASIRRAVSAEITRNHARGLYRTSGLISNPGRMAMEKFACDDFRADTFFFIPPPQESMPVFIGFCGTDTGVEVMISMARVMASDGRMDEIFRRVIADLEPADTRTRQQAG